MAPPSRRSSDRLALAAFVSLGLPDGMLGTAWPSIRRSLDAPTGDLGLVLLLVTAGATTMALLVDLLIRRAGVARLVGGALLVGSAAAAGFALAPDLGALLAVAVLFGIGSGSLDAGINSAVGTSGRRRLLNLLHGFYGVGAAAGPLLVTAAVLTGSWRPAYAVLVAIDLAMGVAWLALHRRAGEEMVGEPAATAPRPGGDGPARPRLATGVGVGVFFVYTGLEVTAGQWETTFGRTHLHLAPAAAGLATFGYWAALTVVRLALGAVPRPPSALCVVRIGGAVALVATAAVWWAPDDAVVIVAFAVLGGALAGVFPSLVALTPLRFGDDRAARVIAWQVGAAAAGGAAISGVVGLLVGLRGVAVLGPVLVVLAVVLLGTEWALGRLTRPEPIG